MVGIPLILGLLPSLFWLFFFLTEDWDHPEPKKVITYVFLGGGLAALLAAPPEIFLQKLFPEVAFLDGGSLFLIPFAFIEEFAKFAIVYLLIKKSTYFDERVDAMIYMITAGLGFAALENILNLLNTPFIAEVTLVRGIGATLLHALASALLGFYWIRKRLFFGIIAATLLHAVFNFLVFELRGFEIYASSILFFAAIVVFHDFEILKKEDREGTKTKRRFTLRS